MQMDGFDPAVGFLTGPNIGPWHVSQLRPKTESNAKGKYLCNHLRLDISDIFSSPPDPSPTPNTPKSTSNFGCNPIKLHHKNLS